MRLEFELIGVARVETTLSGIARRALHLGPVFKVAENILEAGEAEAFEGDQLVDTGLLRASLTQSDANHAIREAHHDELIFGTSVPYARAAASRAGESVLRISQDDAHEIAALTLEFVVRGP